MSVPQVDLDPARVRAPLTRTEKWALFWFLFIGLGALIGVVFLWFMPVKLGMTPLLALMQQNLPFAEVFFTGFVWPGVFLLLVVGVPNLLGAKLVSRRSQWMGWWAAGCGLLLIGWTALQVFVAFGPNPMSIAYMVFGMAQTVTGLMALRRQKVHD